MELKKARLRSAKVIRELFEAKNSELKDVQLSRIAEKIEKCLQDETSRDYFVEDDDLLPDTKVALVGLGYICSVVNGVNRVSWEKKKDNGSGIKAFQSLAMQKIMKKKEEQKEVDKEEVLEEKDKTEKKIKDVQ